MSRKKRGSKLPSGTYRIRAYDYTDDDGKKHYKSFSGRTKAEASAKMAEWKEGKRELRERVTVKRACEDYISLKEAVLSPTTVRGYRNNLKAVCGHPIAGKDLKDLEPMDVQRFVSDMSRDKAPKYVKNLASFLTRAVAVYLPDFKADITLPRSRKPELYIPDAGDIQKLLDACDSDELKIAVLFAAVGTMRRGEVCGVTFADVNYKLRTVTVNKAMVYTDNSHYGIVPPKTYESSRVIRFPGYVIDLIKGLGRKEGYVVGMEPRQLYRHFKKAIERAGLPDFRFHDLRHYAASSMHAAGVPDRYIEAIGGWQPGSNVLKRVYENVLDSELVKVVDRMDKTVMFAV